MPGLLGQPEHAFIHAQRRKVRQLEPGQIIGFIAYLNRLPRSGHQEKTDVVMFVLGLRGSRWNPVDIDVQRKRSLRRSPLPAFRR